MKYAVRWILAAGLACSATAADFEWTLIGESSEVPGGGNAPALFDGGVSFRSGGIRWAGAAAADGCGVEFRFPEPVELSRIAVVSCKPNQLPYTQDRTEIFYRSDGKWVSVGVVEDVTGHARDAGFSADAIRTEWNGGGEVSDEWRVVMSGGGVWLTEIELFGGAPGAPVRKLLPLRQQLLRTEKPEEAGSGARACVDWWTLERCWIGNPNQLNRGDRSLCRFDLSKFLLAGKVRRATLKFALAPFGQIDENVIVLERLTRERQNLSPNDVLSSDGKTLSEFRLTPESPSRLGCTVDLTDVVNEMLAAGRVQLVLRWRDETVDATGNRRNQAEGASLLPETITLEFAE